MRRREFIAGLGSTTLVVRPGAPRAQQRMPSIGYLNPGPADLDSAVLRGLHQGLAERGFVEGRNVVIEYRWADNYLERLPAMAADLVQRQVNVISAPGVPAVRAAKAATSAIPIVFGLGVDPVALGLVASLNRPGGNVTGVSTLGGELGAKRLELIHETVPGASLIGALINPTNPSGDSQKKELQAAAQVLGVRLEIVPASTDRDLEGVFASLRAARAGALVIGNDGFLLSREKQLAALALRHSIPAIFQFRGFATAGGLMSYGTDRTEEWRLHGIYVSRILNGEKPADLPVQQAVKVELVINLKTAKALGLTIPETLLATANEVIE